jgi:hypothetical protein
MDWLMSPYTLQLIWRSEATSGNLPQTLIKHTLGGIFHDLSLDIAPLDAVDSAKAHPFNRKGLGQLQDPSL